MRIEHYLLNKIISSNHLCVIPNYFLGSFECDVFALNNNMYSTEYEIKRSKADFNNDFKKIKTKYRNWYDDYPMNISKHEQIQNGQRTNRFYFVIKTGLNIEVPKYAGLIEYKNRLDYFEFIYIKKAPLLHKNKTTDEQLRYCLSNLSWRYNHQIWELNRQLNIKNP